MQSEREQWVDVADQLRERENVGSAARDYLANERTYLAWLRTGFGTSALGLAVAKLLGTPGDWRPIAAGILFVVLGLIMLLHGTMRYFRVVRALDEGFVEVSRAGPIWFGFTAVGFGIVVAVLILA